MMLRVIEAVIYSRSAIRAEMGLLKEQNLGSSFMEVKQDLAPLLRRIKAS